MTQQTSEQSIFLHAIGLPSLEDRAAYLDEVYRDKPELRAELDALLAAHDRLGGGLSPTKGQELAGRASAEARVDGPASEGGERVGAVLSSRYKLVEEIGGGGMGNVWMAHQTEPVKRLVAVKLIKAGMDSKQVLARFEAERQALALMDHPNIARVFDAGTTAMGRPYFVMELVKGVPLTKYCDEHRLTPRERLELFMPVCQALQHSHQKGIIHRDIKPSNVLVALYDGKPVPKVIDFGIAKATGQQLTDRTLVTGFGAVVGTLEYMSPEQAELNQLDIDIRSDIYSLGVLLYELLTGSPPFSPKELEKAGMLEMLRVIREQEPAKPSTRLSTADGLPTLAANRGTEPAKLTKLVRGELDWIVMKALEKDRNRRYESANGFAADVNRYLAGEPVLAYPTSTGYRLMKFVRRHQPQVIAASLLLLALVAGIIGTTIGLVQANWAADAERTAKEDAVEQKRLAQEAADREGKAKVREAQRADGELKAKLDAEMKRREAERNLAFAKKANEILGSVFLGLNPQTIAESGRPLQDVLRQNLTKAVTELDGSAIGDPLDVAAMQNILGVSLVALGEDSLAIEVLQKALDTHRAKLGPDHPDTLASMNNLGSVYGRGMQLAKAVPLLEETLERRKARLGSDDPDTLRTMSNLAVAYENHGQLAKAVPLHEETLEKMKVKLGPDHPDTLASMSFLAGAYRAGGQLAKAVPLFEETVEKRKARLGPDHPETLRSMHFLARAYRASGEFAKAVPLLEVTVEKRKAMLGPDHPDTLGSMSNLAAAYKDAGQLPKAIPLYEETLEKMKARLGPGHSETLTTMGNLAAAYQASGQLAKAVPLLEETLEKMKANLGPDHPNTLVGMVVLAGAYRADSQIAKAVPLYEETLEKLKAKLGPDHPETLAGMINLADAYQVNSQFAKAVPLYEETLEKMKAKLGPDHPYTLTGTNNLAKAYEAGGQPAKAVPLFEETLATMKAKLGPDHPETLNTTDNLAMAYLARGQLAKAVPLLEETLQKKKAVLGPDHPYTLTSMNNLGKAYVAARQGEQAATAFAAFVDGIRMRMPKDSPQLAGQLAQVSLDLITCAQYVAAEALLRECLTIREKTQPDSWTTFNTMSMLGGAMLGQKKHEGAEPLLLKGYEGMKEREELIPPEGKVRIPEAIDRIIELYTATNASAEVKKWQAERAKYTTDDPKAREKN